MDQRVNRTRAVGVSADQQRMKTECLTQMFVFDKPRHRRIHAAVGSQTSQLRGHPDHVTEAKKRDRTEFFVSLLKDPPRVFGKAAVTRLVGRIDRPDLLEQAGLAGDIFERRAVGPLQAIHWLDRQQFDKVFHVATAHLKKLLDAMRCCDDRWAGIKREPVIMVDVSPAAGFVPSFETGGFESHRLQTDRGGQPPESAADDSGPPARAALRSAR